MSCLLKDRLCDIWEEVGHLVGVAVLGTMNLRDLLARFRDKFASVIEVQQLAKEFHDLHQTTETVTEITAMFRERAFLVPQYVMEEEIKRPDIIRCCGVISASL